MTRAAAAHVVAVVSVVGTIVGSLRPARADFDIQAAVTGGVSWRRAVPTLTGEATSTAARDVPESGVPIGGALTSLGAAFDLGVTIDDRWIVPTLGLGGYGALGSYDTVVTSADGSIARVRPWTTYEIDALLPGLGYRAKQRRFMFSASVRSGLTYLHANGSVAGGGDEQPMKLSGYSLLVQAEIEACRRLDPMTRACLHIAPRIYDFGFMNGATFGLRVEWGR